MLESHVTYSIDCQVQRNDAREKKKQKRKKSVCVCFVVHYYSSVWKWTVGNCCRYNQSIHTYINRLWFVLN